jgi:hypothetical protein
LPDVILLDSQMPNMSGPQFLKAVASEDRLKLLRSIPVILCSGNLSGNESEEESEAKAWGVAAVLCKPIMKASVIQKINTVLSNNRSSADEGNRENVKRADGGVNRKRNKQSVSVGCKSSTFASFFEEYNSLGYITFGPTERNSRLGKIFHMKLFVPGLYFDLDKEYMYLREKEQYSYDKPLSFFYASIFQQITDTISGVGVGFDVDEFFWEPRERPNCEYLCLSKVMREVWVNALEALCDIRCVNKGLIEVICRLDTEKVEISIKDNGIGAQGIELEKFFKEKFSTKKERYLNQGLGLTNSRKFIEKAYNGNIYLEHNFSSRGLTAVIVLPIHADGGVSLVNTQELVNLVLQDTANKKVFQLSTHPSSASVYIVRSHGKAACARELAFLEKKIKNDSVMLFFDAHSDILGDVPPYSRPRTTQDALKLDYGIASHVSPAIERGLVGEFFWVLCSDSAEHDIPEGLELWYCAKYSDNKERDKVYLAHYDPRLTRLAARVKGDVREVLIHKTSLDELPDFPEEVRSIILEIDEDYFMERVESLATIYSGKELDMAVKKIIRGRIEELIDNLAEKSILPGVVILVLSAPTDLEDPGYVPQELMPFITQGLLEGLSDSGFISLLAHTPADIKENKFLVQTHEADRNNSTDGGSVKRVNLDVFKPYQQKILKITRLKYRWKLIFRVKITYRWLLIFREKNRKKGIRIRMSPGHKSAKLYKKKAVSKAKYKQNKPNKGPEKIKINLELNNALNGLEFGSGIAQNIASQVVSAQMVSSFI